MLVVLFEDNHLIAAAKPAGIPTQPSPDSQNSLEDQVKAYIKEKYQKPGAVYLHAVHRLDKAASGIVLFAKTSKALSRMNEQIRENKIQKEYLALVAGHFSKKTDTLENYLFHAEHHAKVVSKSNPEGKKSSLTYAVEKESGPHTLLRVQLHTGRYHQIRAQLSHIHHPIIGDTKYGSTHSHHPGICLHHHKMSFTHPVTGQAVVIESDKPAAWPG